MFGEFFLFEREGEPPARGERMLLGQKEGWDEARLQETLFAYPELLPIRDLDPSFGPLTPLCRELRTEAGRVDNLYINGHGRLTFLECKLWKNPEARREVVAQILDYARAIRRWSYSDLQRQVAMATGMQGNAPFELAKRSNPGLVEHVFIDATAAALRHGRFMLIIAGDGIREDVGALAELINRNAASGFALGLVEVALYGLPDGAIAVQPRIVARTTNIERTVVVLRDPKGEPVAGDAEEELSAPIRTETVATKVSEGDKAAHTAWWAPVVNMTFDDPDQDHPRLFWRNNLRVPLPWPNVWLLAYSRAAKKEYGVTRSEGGRASLKTLTPLLHDFREQILADLPVGSEVRPNSDGQSYFGIVRPQQAFASDDDARAWMRDTLNAYVNVFRPFLKRLALEAP